MKTRPEILILIGPPCCGKSTFCKNQIYKDYQIISRDAIIEETHPEYTYTDAFKICNHKEIDKIFKERLFSALENKKSIIVDKTNMTSKSRRKLLANVSKDYQKIAVVFNWDLVTLKERNLKRYVEEGKFIPDSVFEDMIKSYVPVRDDEGFNKVIQPK